VLRLALVFVLALTLGGLASGLLATRYLPMPAPSTVSGPDAAPDDAAASAAVQSMKHLPDWVQTRRVATLWSGPDSQATAFTSLPAWTFLAVTGASGARLAVAYTGDGQARQPGPGWVNLDDVQPSDQNGTWLRTHRASHLFDAPVGGSATTDVPQWSWLLQLDAAPSPAGRLHVRLYASSLHALIADGWVPADDLGPTGPPQQSVYTAATKPAPTAESIPSHDAFITQVAKAATASSPVPVSVTVAQAILESNWGQSALSREANNYFGIKASSGIGTDGAVWMPTLEYVNGGSYTVVAPFRAYRSLGDSVADHAALLERVGRYQDVLQVTNDPNEFARRMAHDGYATDPAYADKLIDLMQRYNLYQFDAKPAPGPQNAATA